jgi:hypothetical protein
MVVDGFRFGLFLRVCGFGTRNMCCEDIPIFNVEFGVFCSQCYGV